MKNWQTTLGQIMTAISLVPIALSQLGVEELPDEVKKIGLVCAFISFIWTGLKTKDHNVTGGTKQSIGGTIPPPDKDEK